MRLDRVRNPRKEQIVKRSSGNETREGSGNGARNLGGHLGYGNFNGRVDCLESTTKKRPRRAAGEYRLVIKTMKKTNKTEQKSSGIFRLTKNDGVSVSLVLPMEAAARLSRKAKAEGKAVVEYIQATLIASANGKGAK